LPFLCGIPKERAENICYLIENCIRGWAESGKQFVTQGDKRFTLLPRRPRFVQDEGTVHCLIPQARGVAQCRWSIVLTKGMDIIASKKALLRLGPALCGTQDEDKYRESLRAQITIPFS
jgi:hypothetical protein